MPGRDAASLRGPRRHKQHHQHHQHQHHHQQQRGKSYPRSAALPSPSAAALAADSFLAGEPTRGAAPPATPWGFAFLLFCQTGAKLPKKPSSRGCDTAAPLSFTGTAQPRKNTSFQQPGRATDALRGPPQAPRALKVRSCCAGAFPVRAVLLSSVPCRVRWVPQTTVPKPCRPSRGDTHPNRGCFPASSRASACDGERKHQSWVCFHGNGLKKKNKTPKCWLQGRKCHLFPTIKGCPR